MCQTCFTKGSLFLAAIISESLVYRECLTHGTLLCLSKLNKGNCRIHYGIRWHLIVWICCHPFDQSIIVQWGWWHIFVELWLTVVSQESQQWEWHRQITRFLNRKTIRLTVKDVCPTVSGGPPSWSPFLTAVASFESDHGMNSTVATTTTATTSRP